MRVLFLVSDAAMFAAEPLLVQMLKDGLFSVRLAAIPDFRRPPDIVETMRLACEAYLLKKYSEETVIRIKPDADGNWPDLLADADIVCYPTPHDFSDFKYCIQYSAGRDVLPIMVNYGFYRSIYDRKIMASANYAHLWKAFFECEDTMTEYRRCSLTKGDNAELVGYVKMDALAEVVPTPHTRKRILVALHHSIDGGKNDDLLLATILERAEFLASLPAAYPEMDFIFRPHPYLIQALSRDAAWGMVRTESYIQRLRAMPNVIWSEGGDYFPVFANSDGCIQDCGSYLVEYVYTGKPCCYMLHSPEDIERKFSPLGQKCLSVCYLAYGEREITAFLENVIRDGKDIKEEARHILGREIMIEYPNAARRALRGIRDNLLSAKKDEE